MLIYEKTVEGERHLYGTVENSVPSENDVRLTYKDQDGSEVTPSLDKSYFDDGKGGIKDEDGNAVNVFIDETMVIPADSEEPVPTKEVVSIEVTNMPLITEYEEGEELDLTGLEVTATYDDESTKVVTGYTTDPANGDVLAEGDELVEVTYKEKTTTFPITIRVVVPADNVDDINDALANGNSVRLYSNIALEGTKELSVPKDGDVVIDANGQTMAFEQKSIFNKSGITGATNLKVVNAVIEGTNPSTSSYPVVTGRNFSGNITVENCTFKNLRKCAVYMDPNGTNEAHLTIKDCKYENTPLGYSVDMTRPKTNPFNVKVDFINNTGLDKLHEFEIFNGFVCYVKSADNKPLGQYKTIEEAISVAAETDVVIAFTNEVEVPEGYKLVDNGDGTYTVVAE